MLNRKASFKKRIGTGTRTFRTHSGIAADFCRICRCISVVTVDDFCCQPHLCHIGIGPSNVVGRICHCQTCGTEWGLRAETIQEVVPASPQCSLESLAAQTFPRIETVYAERLAQEAIVRQDPFALPLEARLALIADPFHLLAGTIESERRQTALWQNTIGGLAGVIAAGMAVVAYLAHAGHSVPTEILAICLSVAFGLLAAWMVASKTSRFMKRRIYPRLATCLIPLRPSHDELSHVLRQMNSKCAKRTRLQDLLPLIENARPALSRTTSAMADA